MTSNIESNIIGKGGRHIWIDIKPFGYDDEDNNYDGI